MTTYLPYPRETRITTPSGQCATAGGGGGRERGRKRGESGCRALLGKMDGQTGCRPSATRSVKATRFSPLRRGGRAFPWRECHPWRHAVLAGWEPHPSLGLAPREPVMSCTATPALCWQSSAKGMAAVSGQHDEGEHVRLEPDPGGRLDGQTIKVTRPQTSTYV